MTALHADHPVPGFYKMRRHRDGPWQPVAIWRKDGELVCAVGREKTATDPLSVWTYCAGNKVDKDAAKFAFEHGRWPDEPEPVPTRSNMPADPFEALKVEAEDKQAQADAWLKAHPEIKTPTDCDLARNMQAQLLAINKRADGMFTVEKAPLLEATRACDDKYRFRATIADAAARLRRAYERFMVAEETRLKAEAVAKLKAEQERVAAEHARLEAEAKKRMEDDPVAALTSPVAELPAMPLFAEPVKVQAGGGVGRKAGLRDNWVGLIEDYPKTLAYFADHPDVRAAVEKLVKHTVKDSKGSAKIPGVSISNQRVAA